MFFYGCAYLSWLLEPSPWLLEVSEKDIEGRSEWGRLGECEFKIEFTRGLKKDAALRGI